MEWAYRWFYGPCEDQRTVRYFPVRHTPDFDRADSLTAVEHISDLLPGTAIEPPQHERALRHLDPNGEVWIARSKGYRCTRGDVVQVKKAMLAQAKKRPEYRLVKSCPGLGPVHTAELLPVVVTPFRFQSNRGFWASCGLRIVTQSSSDWLKTRTGEWVRTEVKRTRRLN